MRYQVIDCDGNVETKYFKSLSQARLYAETKHITDWEIWDLETGEIFDQWIPGTWPPIKAS